MAQSKKDKTVETLSEEVAALRGDLGDLFATLKEAGVTESKTAMSNAAAVGDVVKDSVADATEAAAGAVQGAATTAQSFMKEKPAVALLAAATAGLVIGLATSKRS